MLTTFNIPLVFIGTASLILSVAAQNCSVIECSDDEYCAANECVEQGTCTTDKDCLNPFNKFQDQLNKMLGHFECEEGTCRKVRGACKDGIDQAVCKKDPCSSGQDSCVSDYCGGCNAIYFDAGGNVMDDPVDNICTSGKDCGEDQYCAGNKCLDHATCNKAIDCDNPLNKFMSIQCVGHFSCLDNNCTKTCDVCEDGSVAIECNNDPCPVNTLDGQRSCVSDHCGGCNVIYFDAGGNAMYDPVDNTCTSGKDCGKDQYCADNKCLDHKTCTTDMDCVNPSNKFEHRLNETKGHFKCTEGICGKVTGCEDKSEPFLCKNDPCSMNTRGDEGPCVSDYCGGCNAIYFDAGGNVMDDPVDNTCTSGDECGEDQYCADNKCLDHGTCKEDMDCVNPSNKFQHQLNKMFGHFKCTEGTCEKVGGCEDESEPVPCTKDPCSASRCGGGVSCVSDYCGGCNSIHFDAGGNDICRNINICGNDDECGDGQSCEAKECVETFECADSPFDIKNKKISRKQFKRSEGKGKGCELVAARNASRCSNLPFRTHCPATCARILGDGAGILCKPDMDTYCTDSKKKWRAPGSGKVRSCKYIGKKQNKIETRCKKYGVTKTCPLTCGAAGCEAP